MQPLVRSCIFPFTALPIHEKCFPGLTPGFAQLFRPFQLHTTRSISQKRWYTVNSPTDVTPPRGFYFLSAPVDEQIPGEYLLELLEQHIKVNRYELRVVHKVLYTPVSLSKRNPLYPSLHDIYLDYGNPDITVTVIRTTTNK